MNILNILNILLFTPKFGDKRGFNQESTKGYSRDGVFDSLLLESLKRKNSRISYSNRAQLLSLKEWLKHYFPYMSIQLNTERKCGSENSNNENGEKIRKGDFRFPVLNLGKELFIRLEDVSENKAALFIPKGEKGISNLKRVLGRKQVFKIRGGDLGEERLENLYKPLKKISFKSFRLKVVKKGNERLFRLEKEQETRGEAPLKTGFFFGVAPVQMVNHRLHIKGIGMKEKSSEQDDKKRVVVRVALKGSEISVVSLKNIKQIFSESLDSSLRASKKEESEHNLGGNREFKEVEFLRKDESSTDTKKNFSNGKRIIVSNSDLNYKLKEEIRKTDGFNGETNLTEKSSVGSLSSNLPINLGKRFRVSADSYVQTLTVGSSSQFLPSKEYGLNRKFFHFPSKFDKKFRVIKDATASFPPGKFPAPKRVAVDRSFPSPVHLFSPVTETPQPLLSDNSPQFQHRHHLNLNTPHPDASSSGFSPAFLADSSLNGGAEREHSFSDSLDHSPRFHPFREDTGFQVSYVDKNLKLLATVRGKVLNLNLNLLADWHIDPSSLKDLTAVIEDSGFIPGKITLKQKKGRYTLFNEKASDELELKV